MEDFPPISREEPPDVLAHFITQYYHDTGIAITWDMNPRRSWASLQRTQKEED